MSKAILIIGIILVFFNIIFFIKMRRDITKFSNRVSFIIDNIIEEKAIVFETNKESILSKLESKFKRLCESLELQRTNVKKDKENIQSLIGDISHQVKTPLSNISLYAETLLYRNLDKEMKDKCLNNILEEEKKLGFLMNSLIKSSRLENGIIKIQKEKVDIEEVLEDVIESVNMEALNKEIEINKDLKSSLVVGDRKWLKEALFNIIDNGVKYSDNNSNINIEVQKGEIFTKVKIQDYGIGINEENLNNIFKRFFREGEVYSIKGVGIGLYLSRYIVESLEGYIKVESVKGIGTTFSVYFLNVTEL